MGVRDETGFCNDCGQFPCMCSQFDPRNIIDEDGICRDCGEYKCKCIDGMNK